MALRASSRRLVQRLVDRAGSVLDGHLEPANGGQADDRPRLLRRRRNQSRLQPVVHRRRGAGAGHRDAFLLRVAAGRESRRRPARPALRAPDWPGRRLPRSQPQRRAGLASVRRQRTAAQRDRFHHVGGPAQPGHRHRQHGDVVRHQPAVGDLFVDRHSAGRVAHRAGLASPAENLPRQPGPRCRCQCAGRRNPGRRAHRAGACARAIRTRPLRRCIEDVRCHRTAPHRHAGVRHRHRHRAGVRRDRRSAVVRRARRGRRQHECRHVGPVRAVRADRRRLGRRAGRSVERVAACRRWHGPHRRAVGRKLGHHRADPSCAAAEPAAWRDPFRAGVVPLPAAAGSAGAGKLRPGRSAGRNRGTGRAFRRRQEHGAVLAAALP
ncbi:hypothetical protein D3C71_1154780 [compost metagenome]